MIKGRMLIIGGPREWKRGQKKFTRLALRRGVKVWHERIMPGHFKRGAAAKYDYRPRSRRYIARKIKTKGHAVDLTFSGRLRRQAKMPPRITGSFRQVIGRLLVPWYVAMVPKKRKAPVMGEELTRVTTHEERVIAKRHGIDVAAQMNKTTGRQTVET